MEMYEVRLIKDDHTTKLWRYKQARYREFSSDQLRYRVLSASIIGNYLFIAEKMALSTFVVMVRLGDHGNLGTRVASKLVLTDDEVDGPIVVSAAFRVGATWKDSWLIINHDRNPEYRREVRLSDHFKEASTAPYSSPTEKK